MKRLVYFLIILAALITGALLGAHAAFAFPDAKGTSVLTGVVIGPTNCLRTITTCAPPPTESFPNGRKTSPSVADKRAASRCT